MAELAWLVCLLVDLGLHLSTSIPVYCVNLTMLHTAINPIFHEREKYIEVDCHFSRTMTLYPYIMFLNLLNLLIFLLSV